MSAYDYAGHARLSEKLDTPIATGEMLSSVAEVSELVKHRSVTLKIRDGRMYMPQAPGLGLSLSDQSGQWRVAHAAT